MKRAIKNKIKRLLMIFLFLFIFTCTKNNVSAYKIVYRAVPLDSTSAVSEVKNWIYERQVSAYDWDIEQYNLKMTGGNAYAPYKEYKKYDDNNPTWLYQYGESVSEDINKFKVDDTPHTTWESFEVYYVYFHPYVNSSYNLENDNIPDGGLPPRYFSVQSQTMRTNTKPSDKTFSPTLSPAYEKLYNVFSESGNYQGIYNKPYNTSTGEQGKLRSPLNSNQNIVIMNNNWHRMAIKNDVYVTQNVITADTAKKLWEKFKNTNLDETGTLLRIYHSSVLRTSPSNNKNARYHQNMDTAYKAWETLVRGSNSGGWFESPATTGTNWDKTIQASRSLINLYDNIVEIPVSGNTYIYVRHIDTNDRSRYPKINYATLKDTAIIDQKNVGKAIVTADDWNYMDSYAAQDTSMEYRTYYSESYKRKSSDKAWRIANLKYDVAGAGSYWQNFLKPEQREKYKDYKCIGAVVGKGDSLIAAEEARDKILGKDSENIDNIDFRKLSQNVETVNDNSTGVISKGGDDTSVIVKANEKYQYIVVDFYYEREQEKTQKIYVRHIDISNKTSVNANTTVSPMVTPFRTIGKAIITADDWDYMESYAAQDTTLPNRVNYSETYLKSDNKAWRLANFKYDHNTAGSYWQTFFNNSQRNTYNKYYCVGAAVGKGNTLEAAVTERNNILGKTGDFRNKAASSSSSTQKILKSGDSTSVIVQSNETYEYTVIDFYYDDKIPGSESKTVYVRHIDITGKENSISSSTINTLITNKKTLSGKGRANVIRNNALGGTIGKSNITVNGYQEVYTTDERLRIFRDPDSNYTCVGSNMVSVSTSSLTQAQTAMNNKLNATSNKIDKNNTEYRDTENNINDVIIIDFYYTNNVTRKIIRKRASGEIIFLHSKC